MVKVGRLVFFFRDFFLRKWRREKMVEFLMSEHSVAYEFLRDQGSFIGGLLALVAGLLLYCVGRQQVRAAKTQILQLKRDRLRNFARESLIAGRLLDGILETVAHNIDSVDKFGNDLSNVIGLDTTNKIREALKQPPLYQVMEYLGQFNIEAIGAYYLLCDRIDQFRMATGETSANALRGELDAIRAARTHCHNEIGDEMAAVNKVLRDTQ